MAEMKFEMHGSDAEPLIILDLLATLATELFPTRWWMWTPNGGWFGPIRRPQDPASTQDAHR